MKNTALFTTFILPLLFFACTQPEDDLQEVTTGKVVFTPEMKEMEVIKLTNARTQEFITKEGRPWITLKRSRNYNGDYSELVIDDWMNESRVYELEPADYSVFLKLYTQEGKNKDRVEAQSEVIQEFTISSGQETQVKINLRANYIAVILQLWNLDGAKAWIGEEGFEPSDEYLYDPQKRADFFIDSGSFEVVVEYQGETKRYKASAHPGNLYFVTVKREVEDAGQATFDWEIIWLTNEKDPIVFEW